MVRKTELSPGVDVSNTGGRVCPKCASAGQDGNFCSVCGSSTSSACPSCHAANTPGAKFCAQCGAPLGGGPLSTPSHARMAQQAVQTWTPWRIVSVLAVVAVLAVAWALTPSGGPGGSPGGPPPAAAPGTPPDISNLSPREQFGRLADRVETAMENGDTTTVVNFFPMVEGAFTNLSAAERDIDARFHIGLLRARIGHFDEGLAQADTIVKEVPNHLFASYLRAILQDLKNDPAAAKQARQDFKKHYQAEVATNRTEYQAHQLMLSDFLKSIPN